MSRHGDRCQNVATFPPYSFSMVMVAFLRPNLFILCRILGKKIET